MRSSLGGFLSDWPKMILVIFVLAGFVAPAHPRSVVLLAVPLTVLYLGGLVLFRYLAGRSDGLAATLAGADADTVL